MTDNTQYRNTTDNPKWVNILIAVGVIWFIYYCVNYGRSADDEATVLVFPNVSNSKNYELVGSVEKDTQMDYLLIPNTTYTIEKFNWPNGGYAHFDNCTVKELNTMTKCTNDHGETYGIKVSQFTPPDTSSN